MMPRNSTGDRRHCLRVTTLTLAISYSLLDMKTTLGRLLHEWQAYID